LTIRTIFLNSASNNNEQVTDRFGGCLYSDSEDDEDADSCDDADGENDSDSDLDFDVKSDVSVKVNKDIILYIYNVSSKY
jgi:hypothetical protein